LTWARSCRRRTVFWSRPRTRIERTLSFSTRARGRLRRADLAGDSPTCLSRRGRVRVIAIWLPFGWC
jgi:hypothetical protein